MRRKKNYRKLFAFNCPVNYFMAMCCNRLQYNSCRYAIHIVIHLRDVLYAEVFYRS